jgi:YVTN family beta-propeller protein
VAGVFNTRNVNLYSEVPLIEIQGNRVKKTPPSGKSFFENLVFRPRTPMHSERYDSDNDGINDAYINDFKSVANAANNMLDIEIAACLGQSVGGNKHDGYASDDAWAEEWVKISGTNKYKRQWPDTMPATADASGTDGTQFIQLILPFKIKRSSIFDKQQANADQVDFLDPDALTIEDESGAHVPCTVLVDGKDADGNKKYTKDSEWDELRGVDIDPGPGKSSIVFIAQPTTGILGDVPSEQAFTTWATLNEIRIHLKRVRNTENQEVNTDSKWAVLKSGLAASEVPKPVVLGVEALDPVRDANGNIIEDPDGPYTLVQRESSFLLHFDKPVVPESVGQSIVFAAEPFNGNMGPIPTSLSINPPPAGQNPCANNGSYHDPIAPNVALYTTLVFPSGTPSGTQGVIPFRVHPLHQNNLCTYVLNPVIDLPGSTDLGTPPFKDPLVTNPTLIRLTVQTYIHDNNMLTGQATSTSIPVNMGAVGYFRETMDTEDATTFTVTSGGRYVNAPVCPHALYYTMGPNGLGVVDLDGNGFTTNDPDFSKVALVTSQFFYLRFGNNGLGIGNNYSYGAKATGGSPYIDLGVNTPMPGINEGSTGIDEVVRDSNGNPQLSPDPGGDEKFFNYTDVEVGDFLDAVFFDLGNRWAHKSFHISAVNQAATGNFSNNLIATPPTPNPPPLTVPIGMRPSHVILDNFDLSREGAFVIMGKEVFTSDLANLAGTIAPNTGFIHLWPADLAGSSVDENFPPNPSTWGGAFVDFLNTGPVAESSTIGFGMIYGSRQQVGNFLFVADKANNKVQVLNSNTMDVVTSLTNLNAPDQVAVSTDLKRLYVSNSGGQSVSVFNVNPRSDNFLFPITQIWVGNQPKGICVQPDAEDVFVCNFGSNTISIINPQTNTVRKTLSALLQKPWDCVMGPRQTTFGFLTGVYHGYISNSGGNNVLVYESGPDGFGGIGFDDILDPVPKTGLNGQAFMPIQGPRGICWDPAFYQQNILSGGCYVAHRAGSFGMVSRIQFTAQQAPNGPIFLIPNSGSIGGTPGFGKRIFVITSQWGGVDNPLSGDAAVDVALMDYNRNAWLNENWLGNFYVTNLGDIGQSPHSFLPANNKSPYRIILGGIAVTNNPDRMFISYQHTPVIDVIDPSSSQVLKTITGLQAPAKVLKTFFKN